jgi:hypothetical protein
MVSDSNRQGRNNGFTVRPRYQLRDYPSIESYNVRPAWRSGIQSDRATSSVHPHVIRFLPAGRSNRDPAEA